MIRVIQSVGSLAPETGGPARSVPHLSLALAEQGVDVTLLSLDLGKNFSEPLIPSHPLLTTIVVPVRLAFRMRTVLIPEFRQKLQAVCREKKPAVLHDHGIWLPQNGMAAQAAKELEIPLVISPRGMLEPWSMEFHRWRKLLAWYLFQKKRFQAASMMHATSRSELESIRNLDIHKPVCVIPNGTLLPERITSRSRGKSDKYTLLFISRIHPKKGLLNLVQAVEKLDFQNWELIIAGYDENNHQADIEAAVQEAGLEDAVIFYGPVEDEKKWELYANCDLFILPSFSENFGIVVAEALAAGSPVITTTGTPWEDLKRYNCGWWIPPTVDGLVTALQDALHRTDEERKEMGARGRKLVEEKYSWQAIAREMIKVYRYLLKDESPPDSLSFGPD